MKRWRMVIVGLAALTSGAMAQAPRVSYIGAVLADGTTLRFSTVSDRGSQQTFSAGVVSSASSDGVLHRVLTDLDGSVLFGYDIKVRRAAQSGHWALNITPLSGVLADSLLRSSRDRGSRANSFKPLMPFVTTGWQVNDLRLGDRTRFDVLIDPVTGEKITDIIEIASDTPLANRPDVIVERTAAPVTWQPLKWVNPALSIDGKLRGQYQLGVAGQFLNLFVPGQGTYYFGADSEPGRAFRKIAMVRGGTLRVNVDGHLIELDCAETIVPGQPGSTTLWVLHDPNKEPEPMRPGGRRGTTRVIPQNQEIVFGAGAMAVQGVRDSPRSRPPNHD